MVLNNRQLPVLGKQTPESKNRELGLGGDSGVVLGGYFI